jgi:hypothetical protein
MEIPRLFSIRKAAGLGIEIAAVFWSAVLLHRFHSGAFGFNRSLFRQIAEPAGGELW